MLNKKQNICIRQTMVKNTREIVNLWKNNALDRAFIKYETTRDFLFNFDLANEFDKYLRNELYEKGFTDSQFEQFICSYVNYRKNEVSTINLYGGIEND